MRHIRDEKEEKYFLLVQEWPSPFQHDDVDDNDGTDDDDDVEDDDDGVDDDDDVDNEKVLFNFF